MAKVLHSPIATWGKFSKEQKELFVLFGLIAVVFGRSLFYPFSLWDDAMHITENPLIVRSSLYDLLRIWTSPVNQLYMPVTSTIWWILSLLSKLLFHVNLAPALFHGVGIVLHGLGTFLAYRLLKHVFLLANWIDKPPTFFNYQFFGALLFALHPLQVECVVWAAGLKDHLSAVMMFLTLYGYISGKSKTKVTILFILALLSKPSTVTIPIMIGLYDWARAKSFKSYWQSKNWKFPFALLVFLVVPYSYLAFLAQPLEALAVRPNWFNNFFIAANCYFFYLQKFLFPAALSPVYDRPIHTILESEAFYFKAYLFILLVAATLWGFRKNKSRGFALGLVIFVVFLLPNSGIVNFVYQNVSTTADHYLYAPLLGLIVMFLAGLRWLETKNVFGFRLLAAVAPLYFLVFSMLQVGVWKDEESLFTRIYEQNLTHSYVLAIQANRLSKADRLEAGDKVALEINRLDPRNTTGYWVHSFYLFLKEDFKGVDDYLNHTYLQQRAFFGDQFASDQVKIKILHALSLSEIGQVKASQTLLEELKSSSRSAPLLETFVSQIAEQQFKHAHFAHAARLYAEASDLAHTESEKFKAQANIAACEIKLNHDTEALATYRGILAKWPKSPYESQILQAIANLEAKPGPKKNSR